MTSIESASRVAERLTLVAELNRTHQKIASLKSELAILKRERAKWLGRTIDEMETPVQDLDGLRDELTEVRTDRD